MEQFFDLSFSRQPDGNIRLIQTSYGEEEIIDAHPAQLLFVARQLCGMKPETAHKVAELERRISVLVDKIQDFVCLHRNREEILDHTPSGLWMLAKLDALLDLALEFDGGRLAPEFGEEKPGPVTTSESAKKCESTNDQLELKV